MAYTQVSFFVVLSLGSTTQGVVIQKGDVFTIAVTLASLWVVSIVSLLVFSEKGYRQTF